MSNESRAILAADGHPAEDQLLLALEHELTPEDVNLVEQHLGNCWSCRARFDEMQRGILAFVEYREKRYLPALEAPPDDSSGFRNRLREVAGESSRVGWRTRIWRWLIPLFAFPRQVRWVSAVAAVMAMVVFWVEVLVNPRPLSADELLTRAVASQNPTQAIENGTEHRVAHQKIRIRNGKQTVVRDFEWTIGSPIPRVQWEAQADPLMWNSPLTAEGFADWRKSLVEKKDKVKRADDLLTLDTKADHDLIKEAWIVVHADDFHPVEQHLLFSDNLRLDFTELSFEIRDEAAPELKAQAKTITAIPAKAPKAAPLPPKADLDEAELELRYALFMHGWDLGEDLVIGRTPGEVTLSGTVSSKERAEAMRATLDMLPNVRLAINLPAFTNGQAAASHSPIAATTIPPVSSTPLLEDAMEKAFASRDDRLAFVDSSIADSDAALSHAWAMKKLVDRYSESDEQRLKPESDGKLREMLQGHLRELSRANSGLQSLIDLLPVSNALTPAIPSTWRGRILSLFIAVQQQDRLVASLVVGTQTAPAAQTNERNVATAAATLRSAHQQVDALVDSLKDISGTSGK